MSEDTVASGSAFSVLSGLCWRCGCCLHCEAAAHAERDAAGDRQETFMYSSMSGGVASQAARPEPCFELRLLLFARGFATPEWLHVCNKHLMLTCLL